MTKKRKKKRQWVPSIEEQDSWDVFVHVLNEDLNEQLLKETIDNIEITKNLTLDGDRKIVDRMFKGDKNG
jgi:hypothetical protein